MKVDKNKEIVYKRAAFGVTAACALGACIMADAAWAKREENTKAFIENEIKQTVEDNPELWTLSINNTFDEDSYISANVTVNNDFYKQIVNSEAQAADDKNEQNSDGLLSAKGNNEISDNKEDISEKTDSLFSNDKADENTNSDAAALEKNVDTNSDTAALDEENVDTNSDTAALDEENVDTNLDKAASNEEDVNLDTVTSDNENDIGFDDIKAEEKLFDIVISKCNEYVNIRKEPSVNSEVVGRLYKDSYGTIIERADGWTKVSSGKVIGYIKNDYLYMDEAAEILIDTKKLAVTRITAGTVNIRAGAGTNSDILKETVNGKEYPSVVSMSKDGWNAIEYNGKTAYVSAEFSKEVYNMKTAVTEESAKKKEKEAAAAAALASAKNVKVTSKNREAIEISDEEIYLMSIVIASEALAESYEGKLAVANVIINRMIDGYWGTTVSSVVYAPGQFSGSATGRFERFANLVNEDCKKAAIEALAGHNNIDDFLYFRTKQTAKYEKYKKYYILGNHCFYEPK